MAAVTTEAIVLGKVLGGTLLAFGQGLIFLLLAARWWKLKMSLAGFAAAAAVMLVISFALTAARGSASLGGWLRRRGFMRS